MASAGSWRLLGAPPEGSWKQHAPRCIGKLLKAPGVWNFESSCSVWNAPKCSWRLLKAPGGSLSYGFAVSLLKFTRKSIESEPGGSRAVFLYISILKSIENQ